MENTDSAKHSRVRNFRMVALASGLVTVLAGVVVLAGWWFDIAVFKSVLPGKSTMKPNTALGFMFSGLALVGLSTGRGAKHFGRPFISFLCSALVATLGVATLGEYVLALNLGIDSLLFRTALLAEGDSFAGRMAPSTALAFFMLALAFNLIDIKHPNFEEGLGTNR
jgi:hypothetical protein